MNKLLNERLRQKDQSRRKVWKMIQDRPEQLAETIANMKALYNTQKTRVILDKDEIVNTFEPGDVNAMSNEEYADYQLTGKGWWCCYYRHTVNTQC